MLYIFLLVILYTYICLLLSVRYPFSLSTLWVGIGIGICICIRICTLIIYNKDNIYIVCVTYSKYIVHILSIRIFFIHYIFTSTLFLISVLYTRNTEYIV